MAEGVLTKSNHYSSFLYSTLRGGVTCQDGFIPHIFRPRFTGRFLLVLKPLGGTHRPHDFDTDMFAPRGGLLPSRYQWGHAAAHRMSR